MKQLLTLLLIISVLSCNERTVQQEGNPAQPKDSVRLSDLSQQLSDSSQKWEDLTRLHISALRHHLSNADSIGKARKRIDKSIDSLKNLIQKNNK
jgi:hypothetical protein